MFHSGYILLVLLAALPLIRTLLKGTDGDAPLIFLHRIYRDFAYIAAAVLGIICFETALNISLQNYWFEELGQRYRYWLALGLRSGILFTVLVSVGIFVGYYLRALCRPLPAVPKSAPWFAAVIFAALLGFAAMSLWVPLLGFLGATSTGATDPVFGKDLSFYLLALPLYDALVGIAVTVLVVTMAFWALIGLAFYPSSGRPWDQAAYRLGWGSPSFRVIDTVDADSWTEGDMIWRRWLRQGVVLAMLLCVAMGVARFLGRYHLVLLSHKIRHHVFI
jgi:uncharacterized membrane protein (UPF0182 family)